MQCSNYINVNNYCNNTGHNYIQGLVLDSQQGYQPVIFKKIGSSNSYKVLDTQLNTQENYGVFSLSGSVYGCSGCGTNCGCKCAGKQGCNCPYLKGVS